jgi:hypothetical protein
MTPALIDPPCAGIDFKKNEFTFPIRRSVVTASPRKSSTKTVHCFGVNESSAFRYESFLGIKKPDENE